MDYLASHSIQFLLTLSSLPHPRRRDDQRHWGGDGHVQVTQDPAEVVAPRTIFTRKPLRMWRGNVEKTLSRLFFSLFVFERFGLQLLDVSDLVRVPRGRIEIGPDG